MPYKNPEDKKKWRVRYAAGNPSKVKRWARAAAERRRLDISPQPRLSPEAARWRRSYQALRERVFNRYGAVCVHCGYDDMRALDLDHVRGHRYPKRKGKKRSYSRDSMLQSLKAPDGEFRILCRNCNWIAWLDRKDKVKASVSRKRGR